MTAMAIDSATELLVSVNVRTSTRIAHQGGSLLLKSKYIGHI